MFLPLASAATHACSTIGLDVTPTLVTSLVLSRLDYCNSVFAGLPASILGRLQRVLHAAARLVNGLRPHDHARVAYTQGIALAADQASTTNCASWCTKWWLAMRHGMLIAVADVPSRSTLRAASNGDYVVPRSRTRLKFGERLLLLRTVI